MEQIAWILGDRFLYWSSVILALAGAGASVLFLGLYLRSRKHVLAGACALPLSVVLSLGLARLVHWYCLPGGYDGIWQAMTEISGGFALCGVFAGCILTAGILRLGKIAPSMPEMLDCMCIAGSAGIAVGRLASLFNATDRGPVLEGLHSLPWAYPVTDAVSGMTEYRFATFAFQSLIAAGLFLGLLLVDRCRRRRGTVCHGEVTLLFLMIYGASQVVLDSTRYDSIFFRSNGFVSVVQVLGAIALVFAMVVFSVRKVKAGGFRLGFLPVWILQGALLGGAGYMEYYVQRHANQAGAAYGIMCLCLALAVGLTLVPVHGTGGRKTAYVGKFVK